MKKNGSYYHKQCGALTALKDDHFIICTYN